MRPLRYSINITLDGCCDHRESFGDEELHRHVIGNIAQADACGCHIVTVPHDILAKALRMWGQDLDELSLDTVKMFAGDAEKAGYKL